MGLLREILLGLIQGITGFLPVSSSGHLFLFSNMFGMDAGYTTFFLCLLKLSSLLGVFVVMYKDIMKLVIGAYQLILDMFSNVVIFVKKRFKQDKEGYYVLDTNPYKKMVLMVLISTVATCAVAMFIKSIADDMAGMTLAIGICFIISGVILLLTENLGNGSRNIKNMSTFDAIIIGVAQGIAVIPGISRVVMAYASAKAFGYGRSFAIKYAVYLSIPSIVGSALVNLHQLEGTSISISGLSNMLAGMLVCCIVSGLFLKLVMKLAKKGNYMMFAFYGIVLGVIVSVIGFFI